MVTITILGDERARIDEYCKTNPPDITEWAGTGGDDTRLAVPAHFRKTSRRAVPGPVGQVMAQVTAPDAVSRTVQYASWREISNQSEEETRPALDDMMKVTGPFVSRQVAWSSYRCTVQYSATH